MCLSKWLKEDDGFSLIEVILAVAILALVTVPIINYFTYSALRTVDGRDKQTATIAAENTIEELNSYSNYEQIEELTEPVADPSKQVWKKSSSPSSDTLHTYMEREINLNGFKFQAKVKVDYGIYDSDTKAVQGNEKIGEGTGDPLDPDFNDYEIPKPSEVYSPSSVVAIEDDQIDSAISEFYTTLNAETPVPVGESAGLPPAVDMATIRSGIDRTICIDVDYKDPSDAECKVYTVRVYYLYEYEGNKTEVNVQKIDIETKKLKDIFLFYNLLRNDAVNEKVRVRMGDTLSDENIEKLGIYFALQEETVPSGYKLVRVTAIDESTSTNGKEMRATYYTNGDVSHPIDGGDFNVQPITPSSSGGYRSPFVKRERSKRIGRITVDIYEKASDDTLGSEAVAHMETTIGE